MGRDKKCIHNLSGITSWKTAKGFWGGYSITTRLGKTVFKHGRWIKLTGVVSKWSLLLCIFFVETLCCNTTVFVANVFIVLVIRMRERLWIQSHCVEFPAHLFRLCVYRFTDIREATLLVNTADVAGTWFVRSVSHPDAVRRRKPAGLFSFRPYTFCQSKAKITTFHKMQRHQ
jgi:hypothetical protein